jgi:hypothetical protein
VVPSPAVTVVVMVLLPTVRLIGKEELPLATAVPLTVIVAEPSFLVGVSVIELTVLLTVAEYTVVPPANDGLNVPLLIVNADNVASVDDTMVRVPLL